MQQNTPVSDVKVILCRERVTELIKEKCKYLQSVFSRFQNEIDGHTYQTPDGGWQVNFRHDINPSERDNKNDNFAAITLRPGDITVFEVHGGICGRWYAEGGAWDNGRKGWLGWPLTDERPCGGDNRISLFEGGTIFWNSKSPGEQVPRSWKDTAAWLMEESLHGQPWSQAFLGDCYMKGRGVPLNYGLAFKWYNAAKENGCSEVETSLQDAARQFILSL